MTIAMYVYFIYYFSPNLAGDKEAWLSIDKSSNQKSMYVATQVRLLFMYCSYRATVVHFNTYSYPHNYEFILMLRTLYHAKYHLQPSPEMCVRS